MMALHRDWWSGCFLAVGFAAFFVDASTAQEKGSASKGVQHAWSLEGAWTGVVGEENKGAIYVLGQRGKCLELDSAGKAQREIKFPEDSGSVLRLASWPGERGSGLLTFNVWARELRAYDLDGKQLWSYPRGIDDVWAFDLTGDKSDEVIVGYNGRTGLHVLDSKGQLLWKSTAIANVWHVCAGDVLGEGTPQVVTTSAVGQVHIFGSDGKKRRDLDAGCYATMVRVGKLSEKDKAATILVAGSARVAEADQKTVVLAALSGDSAKEWSLELPTGAAPHVYSAYLAPGKPWLAVGMRGGQVHVVDVEKGKAIASVNAQGRLPEVGWAASKDAGTPLLLVATGSKLNAFRVTETN